MSSIAAIVLAMISLLFNKSPVKNIYLGEDINNLKLLQKVFESSVFWNYLISNSKPYSSDYYSLNGEYIKNFGIYNFTPNSFTAKEIKEKNSDGSESDRDAVDVFLYECYARE